MPTVHPDLQEPPKPPHFASRPVVRAGPGDATFLAIPRNLHMITEATPEAPVTTGLCFDRIFSTEGQDPFDSVRWTKRTAVIKDDKGREIFRQDDVEVPVDYGDIPTNVVVSKYFYGDPNKRLADGRPERETSVRQLIFRVARTIANWGLDDGLVDEDSCEVFYAELVVLLLQQYAAFNSPVWFNVGLATEYGIQGTGRAWRWDKQHGYVVQVAPGDAYKYPQGSACFIQSVADNMESIMGLATSEAMLFKYGSGTGTDLSTLRSSREKVSGGGQASGPVSFMIIYDAVASTIKSGGKTRRAAKMQSLKVSHPDVMEFIEAKSKEERKAQALIAGGYDPDFNGEAYSSVRYQNCNMSVRVTDDFLSAVEYGGWWQTTPVLAETPKDKMPCYEARDLMGKIAEGTWACGDPGLQYEDTIQKWHTCPNTGPINASNPCSEYMFLDDTSCNLASLNLLKFRSQHDRSFDVERYRAACKVMITAQEILVDHGSYPSPLIARNSHDFRPLGLGYCNLGTLVMAMGKPYDSNEGRAACAALTAILTGQGYLTSSHIAAHIGAFEGFAVNREPMLNVMKKHRIAVDGIDDYAVDPDLLKAAQGLGPGDRHGPQARLSQQPDQRDRTDWHDRVHDGCRHDRHRARDRAGEVQEPGRRRSAPDRQWYGDIGSAGPGIWGQTSRRDRCSHGEDRHDRGSALPYQ